MESEVTFLRLALAPVRDDGLDEKKKSLLVCRWLLGRLSAYYKGERCLEFWSFECMLRRF